MKKWDVLLLSSGTCVSHFHLSCEFFNAWVLSLENSLTVTCGYWNALHALLKWRTYYLSFKRSIRSVNGTKCHACHTIRTQKPASWGMEGHFYLGFQVKIFTPPPPPHPIGPGPSGSLKEKSVLLKVVSYTFISITHYFVYQRIERFYTCDLVE